MASAGGGILIAAVLAGAVITQVPSTDLTLDMRWNLIVAASMGMLVGLSLLVGENSDRWSKRKLRSVAAALAFAVAATGMIFRHVATIAHSLRIYHQSCDARPRGSGWRCIAYDPPRDAVSVDLVLAIKDRQVNPGAEWFPTRWSTGDSHASVQPNKYGLTVRLEGFKAPERYGVSYRLDGPDNLVDEQATIRNTRAVRIIREQEFPAYWRWCWLTGGSVWLVGALSLCFSPRWLRLLTPRRRAGSHIRE